LAQALFARRTRQAVAQGRGRITAVVRLLRECWRRKGKQYAGDIDGSFHGFKALDMRD
jgi:hypothetical protein